MANILCLYENIIATVAISVKFLKELSEYDSRIGVKSVSISKLNTSDIEWCDVLYMIRPNNECFARIAKAVRKIGITVVYFLDDDLMNLPKGNADMPWRKIGLADAAKSSDIIISFNQNICRIYGEKFHLHRTVVIDMPVPKKDIKQHNDNLNKQIKLVYAAGGGHETLFNKYIRPILEELDRRYGKRISLTFMGVRPDINPNDFDIPITFIDPMPFDEYRKRIETENFDIGLAPLDSSNFTKCKYFNKFIEYAMFGIVGIYSNTEPYTFVVKNGENGILAGDKPQDWLNSICEAIENRKLIEHCRVSSYNTLKTRFEPTTIMDGFIRDIPEVIKGHSNKQLKESSLFYIKMRYGFSRIGDWIYKTGFYFKTGGIKEVAKGIKRRINTIKIEKRAERNKQL